MNPKAILCLRQLSNKKYKFKIKTKIQTQAQNKTQYKKTQYKILNKIQKRQVIQKHNNFYKYKLINLGSMASITKRKQLVNQLRKAHFPFGFQQKEEKSQYSSKYPVHTILNHQQPNGNARKNNFSIGNQNDIDNAAYRSEFKQKFPEYHVKGKQQAIGAKNVGINNIVFGYDKEESYKTNYKDGFNQKDTQNNRVRPIDARKKNIQFGDSLTDFTTTYGRVFDRKNLPLQQNNGTHQVDKTQVRKSHLMLGNDNPNFQTQNSKTYKNSTTPNYHVHKEANKSNIDLGSQSISYASQNKQSFAINGVPQRQIVEKQVIRDFRSAHFHFGFPEKQLDFESEAKQQFSEKPLQILHVNGRKPSNVNLNADGNTYYESSYGKQFANWGVLPKHQLSKYGRKDNILIGTDADSAEKYISEAKQNFGPKPIQKVQSIKLVGTLQLGQEQPDFRTHNQLTYDEKFGRRQNNKVSQQQINKMKALNIVTGFQDGNYNLHSNDYGKKQGERGQLPKDTLNKMKNTNIVLETVANVSNLGGQTSYKASYPLKISNEY